MTDPVNLQFLKTFDKQQIAYAIIGDSRLPPILFLHGGPGSNANPNDAKRFNPDRYCVVMFDQRGCGRSTPMGDITNNTTRNLINDIEQLRSMLNIEQWQVYGGSWGAALALEYAKQYPAQVSSIILRGSFLARKQDLDWFIQPSGVARKHPKAYQELLQQLAPAEGELLTSRLYEVLKHHQATAYNAALAWDNWEATVMGFPTSAPETALDQQQKRIAAKRVYAHYCHHQFFLGDQGVMQNLDCLKNIPVTLIHGKHDQVCPLNAAEELHTALPDSKLIVVDAGHGLHEKNITNALQQLLSN